MRAVVLNCSLKGSPEPSNTQELADVVLEALAERDCAGTVHRLADLDIPPGVVTDAGEGDRWPEIHADLLDAEILIFASPTWLGRPSSLAQRALERMDAMLSEKGDDGNPVAFNRVAGVVVTGNEDGAHHVISEISGALVDIGYTIPGQSWTYWNMGPGPGPEYGDTDHGVEWSHSTAKAMAHNLYSVAEALRRNPVQPQ